MTTTHPNPYIYGRPVRGDEFVNREAELRTVFNRLRNGESTAIVGEPHIGKSSFLLQLADPPAQRAYLGKPEAQRISAVFMDMHSIPTDYGPEAFWAEALEDLAESPGSKTIGRRVQAARDGKYNRRALDKLFRALGNADRKLLLLLDEFERLLKHAKFQDPAFFALLRGLSTHTGGLALVPASRMTVAQMNTLGRGLLDTGSPFFNNMIPVTLKPFNGASRSALLGQAENAFTPPEARYICRVAGNHPFLLQAMAAALLESGGANRQAQAAETFYERVAFHFKDLWEALDDETRTTAVILSLLEFGGRALGKSFSYGEIERVDKFGPELRKLAARGLAERVETTAKGWLWDRENLLVWRGERWTVGSQAFAWWVRDVVIAQTRQIPAYDEWLAGQQYRGLLTKRQWETLTAKAKGAPAWAVQGVGGLARELWKSLSKGE